MPGFVEGLRLKNLLFNLEGKISNKRYAIIGFTLMLCKYIIDALIIYYYTLEFWSPLDYLSPFAVIGKSSATQAPSLLYLVMMFWALPFIWMGLNLTQKRLVDAGKSPWYAILFFVPFINYVLMLTLCFLPSVNTPDSILKKSTTFNISLRSGLIGIITGTVIFICSMWASVYLYNSYGSALFIVTPVLVGLTSSYTLNFNRPTTKTSSVVHTMFTLLLICGVLVLFALEGLICLILAYPIAITLGGMGALFGHYLSRISAPKNTAYSFLVIPIAFLVAVNIDHNAPVDKVSSISSSIEISASREIVWKEFINFKEIETEPAWYFKLGIAYPTKARLVGTGVGATRYCEFSTGAFVEPITTWEYPSLIQFDVISQPQPLQEWSPYGEIYAPHLDNYFRSVKGEFKIEKLANGNTLITGTTWYINEMQPTMYWNFFADQIISKIHDRVLKQIKTQAELTSF